MDTCSKARIFNEDERLLVTQAHAFLKAIHKTNYIDYAKFDFHIEIMMRLVKLKSPHISDVHALTGKVPINSVNMYQSL